MRHQPVAHTTLTPRVSVVIPAFNRARAIGAALRSVQEQTIRDWEVLVVDDGSADGTADVVNDWVKRDTRIRLLRHTGNRGAQAARNTGARAARSEWIAFLDSDDWYLPESLESRLETAEREQAAVVHSECLAIATDGTTRVYHVSPLAGDVYHRLLAQEGPVFPALLVHTTALQSIGYLDERLVAYQEWDTFIRLAKRHPFAFQPAPTFVYDCRNGDTISKNMVRNGLGYEQVLHKHFFAIWRHTGAGTLVRHYQTAALWYQRGNDRRREQRCRALASVWSLTDSHRVVDRMKRWCRSEGRP